MGSVRLERRGGGLKGRTDVPFPSLRGFCDLISISVQLMGLLGLLSTLIYFAPSSIEYI